MPGVRPLVKNLVLALFFLVLTGFTAGCDQEQNTVQEDSQEPTVNAAPNDGLEYRHIGVTSAVTDVQPMTGIVFWTDNEEYVNTDAISLEYSYMPYNDIVASEGVYDWNAVDRLLDQVAGRGHQTILRFYYVYPGCRTTVPDYIKRLGDYSETSGIGDGNGDTWYPDWSHPVLMDFTLDFFTEFARRYDDDPRLAFLEVGFGLWAEYHIYDGPMELGVTFPSKDFQTTFLQHLNSQFKTLRWSISIDAADDQNTPLAADPDLLALDIGLFDDSFMHAGHDDYNRSCFEFFGMDRYERAPMGGEFSYYTSHDQQYALSPEGPHGIPFETFSADYHITFMIGNDQPDYQTLTRIREVGLATGYRFEITTFTSSPADTRVTVLNSGVAPIYYDAYVSVNGVRADASLKGLLPGRRQDFIINLGSLEGDDLQLRIACDRLVEGQQIQYDADLQGSTQPHEPIGLRIPTR
jgi:hypothetical protein